MAIHPSEKLYRLLCIIISILVALIMIGTGAAFIKKRNGHTGAPQDIPEQKTAYLPPKEYALYGDLGQIRAVTADMPPITVVLKPFLEYKSSDTAFQEELVNKKEYVKQAIIDWIGLESAYRLSSELPQDIKQALIRRINEQLILGQIHNIYFEEFVILY